MTFETCMLMSRTHIWHYWRQSTFFTDCLLQSYDNGFIRSDSVISSGSNLNIRNSNLYILFRDLVHFTDSRKDCNCLDHSEHSWINSLSFFPSFLFCCFVFDLRCWTRVWLKYLVYCYFPLFNFVAIFLLTL